MVNPFDPKTVVLAKHAQHVVLVHFPIALFLTAVGFDCAAQWTKKPAYALVARYNLMIAALATLPTVVTGLLAWQWQLGGHKVKGILLQHLLLGVVSTVLIWVAWWIHARAARRQVVLPQYRLMVELLAVLLVGATGHLGGFLSGVNGG